MKYKYNCAMCGSEIERHHKTLTRAACFDCKMKRNREAGKKKYPHISKGISVSNKKTKPDDIPVKN